MVKLAGVVIAIPCPLLANSLIIARVESFSGSISSHGYIIKQTFIVGFFRILNILKVRKK
jgi:hypothetical protein